MWVPIAMIVGESIVHKTCTILTVKMKATNVHTNTSGMLLFQTIQQ